MRLATWKRIQLKAEKRRKTVEARRLHKLKSTRHGMIFTRLNAGSDVSREIANIGLMESVGLLMGMRKRKVNPTQAPGSEK